MPDQRRIRAALALVFLWFFLGGIAHFAFMEVEMRAVPPWISWPREAVIVSGVFELLGATGLLWPRTRRVAAWGLFALTMAVTPANVYMFQHPAMFASVPAWALAARLPLQLVLLVLIAWIAVRSTRPEKGAQSTKSADALRSQPGLQTHHHT